MGTVRRRVDADGDRGDRAVCAVVPVKEKRAAEPGQRGLSRVDPDTGI
jgi:hypothetical protein